MAHCPECKSEVGDDFGLITCGKCGSSLFIDMDGQVIAGENRDSGFGAEEPMATKEVTQASAVRDSAVRDSAVRGGSFRETYFELSEEEVEQAAEHAAAQEESHEETYEEVHEENTEEVYGEQVEEPPPVPTTIREASFVQDDVNFGEPEQEPEAEPESDPQAEYEPDPEPAVGAVYRAPTSSDFKDVMEFANSDQSQARDGTLKYHLVISGIDTTDLRNAIKEALTDKRFIWDIEAVMRGIKDGVLELDQVSAVKAFVLLSRIAHLPIQITWTQQPLNQP